MSGTSQESAGPSEGTETLTDHERTERERSFTRRALLQAGWTAPVIMVAALPNTASAQSGHVDGHADHTDHSDGGHTDGGFQDSSHTDHADHADHNDNAHTDIHQDTGFSDGFLDGST